MSRPRPSGRVTAPKSDREVEGAIDNGIPPLRKRRPAVFWFVVIATLAMVLTTFASFIQALS